MRISILHIKGKAKCKFVNSRKYVIGAIEKYPIYIGWDIEITHLKTGRNILTNVIVEVPSTFKDVTDNSLVE
jgi:hypothetical protein